MLLLGQVSDRQSSMLASQLGHSIKIQISYMQEICRIGQDFLHILFICMKCCPILCQICVGNVRKCHILENRTCRKFYFWSSGSSVANCTLAGIVKWPHWTAAAIVSTERGIAWIDN